MPCLGIHILNPALILDVPLILLIFEIETNFTFRRGRNIVTLNSTQNKERSNNEFMNMFRNLSYILSKIHAW